MTKDPHLIKFDEFLALIQASTATMPQQREIIISAINIIIGFSECRHDRSEENKYLVNVATAHLVRVVEKFVIDREEGTAILTAFGNASNRRKANWADLLDVARKTRKANA